MYREKILSKGEFDMQRKLIFISAVCIVLVLLIAMTPIIALACENDPPGPRNAYQNGPGPQSQYQYERHKGGEYHPEYQYRYQEYNGPADMPGYQYQL